MFEYAQIIFHGDGVPVNKNESIKYYKKADDEDHVEAMFKYALIIKTDDEISNDNLEALKYYKKAADKGHIVAMHNYLRMLHQELEQNQTKMQYNTSKWLQIKVMPIQ